jgi:hypothetical protein
MKRSFIGCVTLVLSLVLLGCSKKDDPSSAVTPPTSTTTTAPSSSTTAAASSMAIVTTLAGNGDEGYVDATGSAARFKNPVSIVCDKNDNIYVVDLNNARIRLVSPTGSVTTLAGTGTIGVADGVGTNAKFYLTSSAHVTRDVAGNLLLRKHGHWHRYPENHANGCGEYATLCTTRHRYSTGFLRAGECSKR